MKRKIIIILGFLFLSAAILLTPLVFGFGKTGKDIKVLGKNYSLLNKSKSRAN